MFKNPLRASLILLASTLSLATSMTASAAGHMRSFEIEHLSQIKNAGNITLSPNGKIIAYTLSVPRDVVAGDDDGNSDSHLYVIQDDSKPIRFIGGKESVSSLQFSADGQTLYFKSKREGDKQTSLYAISMFGGEAEKRFEFDTSIGDYAVSSDGEQLFFIAKEEDKKEEMSEKGFKAYAFEEDHRLASLWSVSLSDKSAKATKLYASGHVSNFQLSANNKLIVAAVAPTNLVDDSLMKRDLVFINTSDGEETNRIDVPGKLGSFELSENAKEIAFLAASDIHDTSAGVLMHAKTDGSDFTQLNKDALQQVVDVDWYDGDLLAVVHEGVESALVLYSDSGKVKTRFKIADDIVVRSADVGDDEIGFIADSPKHPREVFSVKRKKGRKLSNHNAFLDDIDLAEQTTFTYQARDGREIQGLLITPNGDAPSGGWPLILTVHGGPEAHFSDGWITRYSNPGQFAAADGYAVYYPNYRGSTGRGVAFAKEHQGDYAGKEFNDLVDGVKALTEAGIINKDRVGITGGSYGGYASMWGATAQTEVFAAAVAFVGISNQVSKFGTSDIPNEMHLVHSLKWPWEDNWMNLLQRSPLYHAGKSTTPTLIMHGEEDTRVHPSQSMELYRSMKVRTETPVRLVFYPGEGHGNRKAAAQYDYALRLMRWMDTYLAPDATRKDAMPDFDLGMEDRLKKEDSEEHDKESE